MLRASLAIAAVGLLVACASDEPAPVIDRSLPSAPHRARSPASAAGASLREATGEYRVVAGDTLYSIAFRHGLDYRELAAWNGIGPPYRIYAGQRLRLTPPTARPAAPPTTSIAASHDAHAEHPPTAPVSASAASANPDQPIVAGHDAHAEHPPIAPVSASAASANPDRPVAAAARSAADGRWVAATGKPVTESPRPAEPTPELRAGGVAWRWPALGEVIGTFVAGDPTRQGIDIAGREGDPVVAAADGEVVYSGNGLLGYGELVIIKHDANFLSAYGHNRKRLVQEGERVKAGQRIAEMGASAAARDELHFEIRRNGKPVNPLEYLPVR
jgi:lipoprotein NlpD